MFRSTGFNLLELLIALAVGAVLAATGVPAMRALILDSRLSAAANDFVHAVHLARQESQKRSVPVELCPRRAVAACGSTGNWSDGWQVTALAVGGPNRQSPDVLRRSEAPAGLRVESNRRSFSFRPFTLRDTNGTVWFCDERGIGSARAVVISPTGRPRLGLASEAKSELKCGQ